MKKETKNKIYRVFDAIIRIGYFMFLAILPLLIIDISLKTGYMEKQSIMHYFITIIAMLYLVGLAKKRKYL